MKLLTLIFISCIPVWLAAQNPFTGKPQYQIVTKRADTTLGIIKVELFPAVAPLHVLNFDSLVKDKFYDSTAFHRVIPGFVIQGGDPNSRSGPTGTWGFGDPSQQTVPAEFSPLPHRRGILSAARRGNDINSATSQFFICVARAANLDNQYTAYGKVIEGMDVVDKIAAAPRDSRDIPNTKISMFITYIGSNDSITENATLIEPANRLVDSASKRLFRWNAVPGAILYGFQIGTDPTFQTNVAYSGVYPDTITGVSLSGLVFGTTYYWRVIATNGGNISFSETRALTINFTTHTGEFSAINAPAAIRLTNYPNPFRNTTYIQYYLPNPTDITLKLYNTAGQEVKLIESGRRDRGEYVSLLETTGLPAGVYFYRLTAGQESLQRTLVIE
jgi:cyclophilin family peptidyl-prolyl cis-trans isomerase